MTNKKRIFVEQDSRTTLRDYAAEVSKSKTTPQYLAAILGESIEFLFIFCNGDLKNGVIRLFWVHMRFLQKRSDRYSWFL